MKPAAARASVASLVLLPPQVVHDDDLDDFLELMRDQPKAAEPDPEAVVAHVGVRLSRTQPGLVDVVQHRVVSRHIIKAQYTDSTV